MNCRDIESLILAERDGELSKAQLAALSDHVAACPACHRLRDNLKTALDEFKSSVAAMPVPDADTAWRDLQVRLRDRKSESRRRHPLAPIIWFTAPLAAAAAIAFAFIITRPVNPTPSPVMASTLMQPLHDPSIIAGADFVEAGDPNASTLVYVDKESGWLVVWATDADTNTSG